MTTPPPTKAAVSYDGTVQGLACGQRPSGVWVGQSPTALANGTVHFVLPPDLAYAPNAASLVRRLSSSLVHTTSDGRVTISRAREDAAPVSAADVLDKLEATLEGGAGGIPERTYGGIFTVARCPDAWEYEVTTKPSGRASLKRVGTWTGTEGVFRVPFDAEADLVGLLDKADTAEVKGATTTINLPDVPGLAVRIEGGEIIIPWPGDADAPTVKAVPSMRWDKARKAYTVS
ncbi:MAG TPA: hypothetical protein VGC15_11000, partial [Acetobacteraceae bacterium]